MRFYIVNSKELTIKTVECDFISCDPGEIIAGIYLRDNNEYAFIELGRAVDFLIASIDEEEHAALARLRYIRKARSAAIEIDGCEHLGADAFNALATIIDPATKITVEGE